MGAERSELEWLDADCEVSFVELVQLSGLTENELRELVEYGALAPKRTEAAQWIFSGACVVTVRAAQRLRRDFELDLNALSVAMGLLERIHALEAELRALHAQRPQRFPGR
jgi:chaperone modulatory protein CbpM